MSKRKQYSELTFTDDFMFCKILAGDMELCKEVLELILGIKIRQVELVQSQVPIEEKYDARGNRLDVYVEDAANTVYDIEMQTTQQADLPKRTRYYQGMIDLNLISKGAHFKELKKAYVIFICAFDPYDRGLPIYTFENTCKEDPGLKLGDDTVKVMLNAGGRRDGLSNEMCAFLDFLQKGSADSDLTRGLCTAVSKAKEHKEWEVEYMTMFMKIQEEREDAQVEQLIESYRELGQSEASIVSKLISKFHLSEEEAQRRVKEYDLQLA